MATSARAPAHAPALSRSLALQASDDINNIHDVHRAYACLEGLIEPKRSNDPAEVYMSRSELGALLRLLNAELQRRICTADTAIESVRVALGV